jgi:hypothetical protein
MKLNKSVRLVVAARFGGIADEKKRSGVIA